MRRARPGHYGIDPRIKIVVIPSTTELFHTEITDKPYHYSCDWEAAKAEPMVITHTSETIGTRCRARILQLGMGNLHHDAVLILSQVIPNPSLKRTPR